ncbi:MAG: hypothetical protein QG577_1499 [Thermodesulfobacteriota bacterium]|nr:hypothetical protein [Thermodesulfobacteriota bacterium]
MAMISKVVALFTFAAVLLSPMPCLSLAEELVVKPCSELIRMAGNYQEDLKTVDTMLGVAIDAGDLDKIRVYKLKKAAVQKDLDALLKAIDIKECATKGK